MVGLSALRRGEDGLDDVVVAGATTEVALKADAYVFLAWRGILFQDTDGCHDHARCAIAALETMVLHEGLLHRVHLATLRQSFDGDDITTVGLHGEHGAALHGFTVHMHGARAATGSVATDIGAGETEVLSDVLHQQSAWLDVTVAAHAVHFHGDFHGLLTSFRAVLPIHAWACTACRCVEFRGGRGRLRPQTELQGSIR